MRKLNGTAQSKKSKHTQSIQRVGTKNAETKQNSKIFPKNHAAIHQAVSLYLDKQKIIKGKQIIIQKKAPKTKKNALNRVQGGVDSILIKASEIDREGIFIENGAKIL